MSPRRQPPITQTSDDREAIQSTAVTAPVSQHSRRSTAAPAAGYNAVPTGA